MSVTLGLLVQLTVLNGQLLDPEGRPVYFQLWFSFQLPPADVSRHIRSVASVTLTGPNNSNVWMIWMTNNVELVRVEAWGHEDDTNVLYRCNWHFPEPLYELLQQPDFFTSQLCNVHITGPQLTRAYYEWVHDDTRWIGTFTDMVTQSQIIVVNNVGPSYITNRNNFLNTYGNRMVNAIAKYDTDDDTN